MREILLATGNPGKAKEMSEILAGEALADKPPAARGSEQFVWRHLREFADHHWAEPVEDGDTFMANAELKAAYYARLSGLWTIADDSGLVVDALGGEPGVRSARYAGEPKSDQANNALLIRRLAGVPDARRSARFCCAVVLSDGQRVLARAEGKVEGRIIDVPRGTNGFGYDPHFWVDRFEMTTAEMAPDQKHAISHRGQALRQLREELAKLLEALQG